MPLRLTLEDWIGCVIGRLLVHGIPIVRDHQEMPPGDPRKTHAYLIAIEKPPVSLVLGTRLRKDGEGREAFFEVCDALVRADNVAACITHHIDLGVKTWTATSTRAFAGTTEGETDNVMRSLDWVDAIAKAIKAQETQPVTIVKVPVPPP